MTMAGIGKFLNNINALPAGQQRTIQAIQQASAKTGVDFAYLVQKANIESSFNPQAKAKTSSASGLYQFVQNTWLDIVDRHGAEYGLQGAADAITRDANNRPVVADKNAKAQILALRNNPQVAAVMAAELAAENAGALKAKVGGKIGATEMYMAHFLGVSGASDLLTAKNTNPNMPAAKLLPKAAAANHNVFYSEGGRAKTVQELYAHFAKKFDGSADVASAEVAKPDEKDSDALRFAQDDIQGKVDCTAPAVVLATITKECATSDVLAQNASYTLQPSAGFITPKERVPELVGTTGVGSLDGLLDHGSQYSAMMLAQQIVDSTQHLSIKDRQHREQNSNQGI